MSSPPARCLVRHDDNTPLDPRPDLDRLADGGARCTRGDDRPQHDPDRPRRLDRGARVDGQRVQPELRRPADDRHGARGPLRPPAHVRRRDRPVHRGLGCLRTGARRRHADRRAHRPGRRRGARDAARARAADRRLPGRAARQGDGPVQRGHRPGRARRPGRRRRYHRGPRLGVDLLAQRADRARGHSARVGAARGELRAAPPAGPPGRRARHRRLARARLGPGARQLGRLGQPGGRRDAGPRRVAGRRVRRLGAAGAGADAAAARLSLARFSAGNAANFFQFASLFGAVFFMAQFLQTGLGYGPLGTGLRMLPWTATLTLVAPFAGVLADRFGERPFIAGGLLLQSAGMAWIALIADPGMAYGELIAPLIVAGSGTSMAMPAMQSAVLGAVAPSDIGHASGPFATLRQLGAAFGLAILVAVFAGAGSYVSPAAFADGFAPAIGVSAGLACAGALAALLVPGRRSARVAATVPAPEA